MKLRIRQPGPMAAPMLQAVTPTKSRTIGRLRPETSGSDTLRERIAAFNRRAQPLPPSAGRARMPGVAAAVHARRLGRPSLQEFILAAHAEFADVLETRTGLRFGERLAAMRLRAGKTQAALARAAGCSQSQIADWERGRSEPGMASLRVLARALGCRMEELVAD